MTEQAIQGKIIKRLEKDGYYVLKLIKTNKNGIADLLVMKKNEYFFVEVKTESGKLSEVQKFRIEELNELGIETKIWTDYGKDYITK